MKDMTQEQIDAYMESIPEWKRGALVVAETEEEQVQKSKGIFERAVDRVKATESFQNFKRSEDYEKIKSVRAEF